jgi:hypothetical protein
VPDAADLYDLHPAETLDDPLEALLDGAIVYAPGQAPPAEVAPELDLPSDAPARPAPAAYEARVSPVFWAAAIVWNLPGGLGGWWLLRKTRPRTARRLLITGIVSFLVIAAVIAAVVIADRSMNPRYIYLAK